MTQKDHSLYILMISIHGLIRGNNLELGRDADTGGQTRYVVELSRALARQAAVARVDLITRSIKETNLSPDYHLPIEILNHKSRIVRINAGPDKYIAKEDLWEHLDEFTEKLYTWLSGQPSKPDVLHSHYADAGYVGIRLSRLMKLPLIHTGHSLGREKMRHLKSIGLSTGELQKRYKISERIRAEEETIKNAKLIITSTQNEIDEQYKLYNNFNPEKMTVIPPGIDLRQFHPPTTSDRILTFTSTLNKYLKDPDKPMILALSRPDERKNIISLVESYGKSKKLQELANLVIVSGNRKDIRDLDDGAKHVLTELLLVIDCHELNGLVAMPKQHSAGDVAEIYRLATKSRGVFINPALTEPFGLTLLEAAASGLPIVATAIGGPVDIIANCKNGLIIDPLDENSITKALLNILEDRKLWELFSHNGQMNVAKFYSWGAHTKKYLKKAIEVSAENRLNNKTATLAETQSLHIKTNKIYTAFKIILHNDTGTLLLIIKLQLQQAPQSLEKLFNILDDRRVFSSNNRYQIFSSGSNQCSVLQSSGLKMHRTKDTDYCTIICNGNTSKGKLDRFYQLVEDKNKRKNSQAMHAAVRVPKRIRVDYLSS